jgi:hypothetical protein
MKDQVQYINYAETKTNEFQEHRAGKMIRAFSKKNKTRVYQADERVLIDVGRRSAVKTQ